MNPFKPDAGQKLERELDAACSTRDKLTDRLKLAETAVAQSRAAAQRLAREGADDALSMLPRLHFAVRRIVILRWPPRLLKTSIKWPPLSARVTTLLRKSYTPKRPLPSRSSCWKLPTLRRLSMLALQNWRMHQQNGRYCW